MSDFEQLVAKFTEELYEKDPTAAIAYEQLQKQHLAGKATHNDIVGYMSLYFNVSPVPEDRREAI